MGSLTTCLRKAGDLLDSSDRKAIISRARALRSEGVASADASRRAVDERMAEVQAMIDNAPEPVAARKEAQVASPEAKELTEREAAIAKPSRKERMLGDLLDQATDPDIKADLRKQIEAERKSRVEQAKGEEYLRLADVAEDADLRRDLESKAAKFGVTRAIPSAEATEIPVGEVIEVGEADIAIDEAAWRADNMIGTQDAERAKALAAALRIDPQGAESAAIQLNNQPRALDRAIDDIISKKEAGNANERQGAAESGEGLQPQAGRGEVGQEAGGRSDQPGESATPGAESESRVRREDADARQRETGKAERFGVPRDAAEQRRVERDLANLDRLRSGRGEPSKTELVDPKNVHAAFARDVADAFRTPIYFVRNTAGQSGWNAFTTSDGRVYINVEGDAPPVALAMHEVGHNLPADLKADMIESVLDTVTLEQRLDFLHQFPGYSRLTKAQQDEEVVMRIIEQDAQNPAFWDTLAQRMGDTRFGRLARSILGALDRILSGFAKEDSSEFTSDIKRVRKAVADAFSMAEARQQMGRPREGGEQFSERRSDVSPLGFYSQLARSIESGPGKGSAQAWKDYIRGQQSKGVKADEVEWSGVNEWLDMQQGPITRDALAEFVRGNGVRVQEVRLGEPEGEYLRMPGGAEYGDTSGAKYGTYVVPGGTNYREVLLTLPVSPEKEMTNQQRAQRMYGRDFYDLEAAEMQAVVDASKAEKGNYAYRSSHWDQPNVLAHFRVDDRTDSDGNRVLFVNEIQSDWGQEGKKKGFATPRWTANEEARVRELERPRPYPGLSAAEREEFAALTSKQETKGTPQAPFVGKTDAWVSLALKRIIKMAADEGYDRVAFINGQQAADLYDLSKQVDRIVVPMVNGDGSRSVRLDPNGGTPIKMMVNDQGVVTWSKPNEFDGKPLSDVVGKEVAERIMKAKAEDVLEGEGLKVGGEGMRTFYDRIIPAVAKDVLKKVGGSLVVSGKRSEPNNIIKHYLNLGQGREAAVAALKPAVDSGVVAALENDKVAKIVVKTLPVDVMNMLADQGVGAEQFAREPKMLIAKLPVDRGLSVANGLSNALSGLGARLRAGLDAARKAGLDLEVLPAVSASDIDTDVAARILFGAGGGGGQRVPDGGMGVGPSGARPGAESSGVTAGAGRVENGPAALAGFVDWHKGIVAQRGGDSLLRSATRFDITPAMREKVAGGLPLFSERRKREVTDTPEFKRWFSGSKVVDADGKPLVVYHGTEKAGFSVFDPERSGSNTGRKFKGFYFTGKMGASTYSGTKRDARIATAEEREFGEDTGPGNYPVYLSMQDPLEVDFNGQGWDAEVDEGSFFGMDDVVRYAIDAGHDGVIARNIIDEGRHGQGYGWDETTYVVFKPEQIKSATGNRGTFDPADPDIRMSERRRTATPDSSATQPPAATMPEREFKRLLAPRDQPRSKSTAQ